MSNISSPSGPHSSSSISAAANNSGPGVGSSVGSHPITHATTTISGGPGSSWSGIGGKNGITPSLFASSAAIQNSGLDIGHLLTPVIPGVTSADVIATHELADRKIAQHVAEWAETQK